MEVEEENDLWVITSADSYCPQQCVYTLSVKLVKLRVWSKEQSSTEPGIVLHSGHATCRALL